MIVGVLKEIKTEENRVAMTPAGVEIMCANGHSLLVESTAGDGSGFSDAIYAGAGAEIVATPEESFKRAEMAMGTLRPAAETTELVNCAGRVQPVACGPGLHRDFSR